MIDQDYSELLGYSPPSVGPSEWTFRAGFLAPTFAILFVLTPTVCMVLYYALDLEDVLDGGAQLQIPTITRLGMYIPATEVFAAGIHLSAILAMCLFWCVRLAHRQRLEAHTEQTLRDGEATRAKGWVTAAWCLGFVGAVCLFLGGSIRGDRSGSLVSTRATLHEALFLGFALGAGGHVLCTARAMSRARSLFVVSSTDLWWYQWKMRVALFMFITLAIGITITFLLAHFLNEKNVTTLSHKGGETGVLMAAVEFHLGGGDDEEGTCGVRWCYSHSMLALMEYALVVGEALFCIGLWHDLKPVRGGFAVESFVL